MFIQEQLTQIQSQKGNIDPNFIKIISESQEKLEAQNSEETKLLLSRIPSNIEQSHHSNNDEEEEIDDDEIDDQKPNSQQKSNLNNSTDNNSTDNNTDNNNIDNKNTKEEIVLDPYPEEDSNELYKKYEDINLYRTELDDSPFAGVDRISAHFKAREREHSRKNPSKKKVYQ